MTDQGKLAVCGVASVVVHVAISRGLDQLPANAAVEPAPHKLELKLVEPKREEPPPPPPPEPEPPPAPVKEPPKPQVVREPPRVTRRAREAEQPKDVPPPDRPPTTTDTTDEPVFGVNMESTSQVGRGPAVPVGNTTRPQPNKGSNAPTEVKQLAEPVAAYEATKMPLPQGRCTGKYTDDAFAAGIEGTVVLDLVVAADGRATEIRVTSGLGHGLDEAAIAALRGCTFSPGEKDGKPVPVRVRGFKVTFVRPEQ